MGDQDSASLEDLMSKNLQLNENTDGFVTQINIENDNDDQVPAVIDLTPLTNNNLLDNSEATFASASVIETQAAHQQPLTVSNEDRRDSNLSSRSMLLMPPPSRVHVEFSEKIKSASRVMESNAIEENQLEMPLSQYGLNLDMSPGGGGTGDDGQFAPDDEPHRHHEPKANPNSPDLKTFRTHNNQQQQGGGPSGGGESSEFMQSSYRSHHSKQMNRQQVNKQQQPPLNYMAQYQSLMSGDGTLAEEDLLLSAKYREQRRHYNRQSDKALSTNLPDIYLGNKFPKRKTFSNKRFYVKYVANKMEKNNEFVNMLRMSSMSSFSSTSMTKTKRRRQQQTVGVSDYGSSSREAFYSPAKSVASNFKPSELTTTTTSNSKPSKSLPRTKSKSRHNVSQQQQQSALGEPILINNVIDLNFMGDKSRLESHFMMPSSRRHLSELHLSDAWPRSNMCSVKANPWVSSFKARTYANEINSTFRGVVPPPQHTLGGSNTINPTFATTKTTAATTGPINSTYLKRSLSFRGAAAAHASKSSHPRLYAAPATNGGERAAQNHMRMMHHNHNVRLKA